jgi:hypothetical protein
LAKRKTDQRREDCSEHSISIFHDSILPFIIFWPSSLISPLANSFPAVHGACSFCLALRKNLTPKAFCQKCRCCVKKKKGSSESCTSAHPWRHEQTGVPIIRRKPESPIAVRETQSTFHPRAQQDAFRCRDVRLQSRSFARWNQSLRHSPNSNRLC